MSRAVAELAEKQLGEVLADRYELQRVLGVGGSGVVFEALHTFTHQSVAVKVLHPHLATQPESVARFLREARAAASIGHPGISLVLDAGTLPSGQPYLVQELLEGRTMDQLIGTLRADQITLIALELLDVLESAHAVRIVHRDVKPENVFLTRREGGALAVRLVDFGVAKNLHSLGTSGVLTQPGMAIGTPTYMAPEQARALEVDARTDVWGAGATLFHALTGRAHFPERTIPMLLMRLVSERPPRVRGVLPDAPEALARAIDGALEPDPAARWPSAAAMADVLRDATG